MRDNPEQWVTPRSFAFGRFVLIPERQLLLESGTPVRVGGRALEILTILVSYPGELVSKRELLARVWPATVVEESNLKVHMAALRRILGEAPGAPEFIATVVGRGYRFVGAVRTSGSPGPMPESSTAPRRPHNLPTGTTRIVGRAEAIDAIRRELDGSRLVSVVGAGGIGKTTVALAVAEHALGMFRDGVWLVDLALLKEPASVANAIATAIGVGVDSDSMLAPLCEHLRRREMLLVLDNCEHLIDAAASGASRILSEAADVKILVTSREPLLVKGERVRRLSGLGTPPPTADLTAQQALAFAAIQLFVDRATDRLESFKLDDAEAPTVAEICRRLDGLALAIELAATRVDAFGVRGLLKQLEDSLGVLTGHRAGPERHRTLTATLDWSYGLLSVREAALLQAVSVYPGAFDLEGTAAVSDMTSTEAADILAQLTAKSLVATNLDAVSVTYRLLETTRAYCLEHLRASGEDQVVRRRHAEHVRAVLERAAAEWAQRPALEWGTAYGRMLDDLRTALSFAGRDAAQRPLLVRLTVSGTLLWNHFSLTHEGLANVARAIEELDAAELAGTATDATLRLSLAGIAGFARGFVPEVLMALQRALDVAVRIGSTDHHLRALRMLANYQKFTGQHDAAIRTLETFTSVAVETDPTALQDAEAHLGTAELFVGRLQVCRERLEKSLQRDPQAFQKRRFAWFQYDRKVDIGNVLSNAQWLTGLPDAAMRTAHATVERALKTRHQLSLSNALAIAACPVAFLSGRHQEADHYVTMLDEHVTRHGIAVWRPIALFYRSALACEQNGASTEAVEGLEQAVAEFRAINHLARMPYYLGVLATALARCGRRGDAEATIQAALASARAQNEQWCIPELLRIRASILIGCGRVDDAEMVLLDSMALADDMGAMSWRLRSANDLAQLRCAGLKVDEARRMLLPVFKAFTEGFETRDLVVAADLLASGVASGEGLR